MTESPIFWLAIALVAGMGVRGYVQGFSRSLFRLQLLVLALVVTGVWLAPTVKLTREWFDWPLYFHQLVFGGLMFGLFYSVACAVMTRLFDRKPTAGEQGQVDPAPETGLGIGSRLMGLVVGLLAGAAIAAVIAFLAGVKPSFDQSDDASALLLDAAGELSSYGFQVDAFDEPAESAVSQLINAIVASPVEGVKLLQRVVAQPEFTAVLASAQAQKLLMQGDAFGLVEEQTFDLLIATAPVQELWALEREMKALTDRQLAHETAAQFIDAYHRVVRVKSHPRVVEMLSDTPFRQYLQSAELGALTRDRRVLELGDVLIGAR